MTIDTILFIYFSILIFIYNILLSPRSVHFSSISVT